MVFALQCSKPATCGLPLFLISQPLHPVFEWRMNNRAVNSTGDQFVEENQRHRDKKARALTVMMAERTPLADAVAAAEAVAVLADGMDNSEFSDDEQSWQSPPPSLPPGPPEDQDPIVTPPPSPPSFGLAGDGGKAGPVASAPTSGVELVNLADLEDLAELPDEAATATFRLFTPKPSPGRGSGPNWAPCTAGGPIALQANQEAARLATFALGRSEIVEAHQHEMVASFLQHQNNSAGQTELAEDAYSSVMPEATQQHQFVPDSMQYNFSSSSLMSMAQQPSLMSATQQHQFVPLQQHQFVPAPLQYNSSSSLMSTAQHLIPAAAYAQAHCAMVISEASSVLAVAQKIVPGSLKEIFAVHVMCNYTPRDPKQFPTSRWATLEELISSLQHHAPMEVQKLGYQNLRQMITDWFKGHPNFRDLPFRAWGKRLKDNNPRAHPRSLTFKFCFEHTPGGLGR